MPWPPPAGLPGGTIGMPFLSPLCPSGRHLPGRPATSPDFGWRGSPPGPSHRSLKCEWGEASRSSPLIVGRLSPALPAYPALPLPAGWPAIMFQFVNAERTRRLTHPHIASARKPRSGTHPQHFLPKTTVQAPIARDAGPLPPSPHTSPASQDQSSRTLGPGPGTGAAMISSVNAQTSASSRSGLGPLPATKLHI